MKADTIIATFMNRERTRAFELLANGELTEVTRKTVSDVWSPPDVVAFPKSAIPALDDLLASIANSIDDAEVLVREEHLVTSDDEVIGTIRHYADGRETVERVQQLIGLAENEEIEEA